jgi:hypothetical protein
MPFRSTLISFLEGNSEVLDRLVVEMYARGMSTRDIEDAFRDVTGELLISRSAVSESRSWCWQSRGRCSCQQQTGSPATTSDRLPDRCGPRVCERHGKPRGAG